MEIEQLAQPHDGREIDQAFALQFRDQFLFRFVLRFAGDRAEQAAGRFLQRFYGAIGQGVTFFTPKFPADVARHIFGIQFQTIEHEAGGFHNVVADAVAGHPGNFIFGHKIATLSGRGFPASVCSGGL